MKSSYLKASYSAAYSMTLMAVAFALPIAHAQQPPASAVRPASAASAPASAASSPSSAPVFVAPQAKPMGDRPYLNPLEGTNTFDAQRKLWPDKRPPAPPPPPPPPPPPIAEKDLQLYGVMIVGSVKRATVKVGSRFASLDAAGRGFVSISEGQTLGDWQLTEIQPTRLVLSPTNGSPTTQMVVFTKKTDRVAAPSPISTPMERPMPTALAPGNDGAAPASPNSAATSAAPPVATAASTAPAAAPTTTPPTPSANPLGNMGGQTNSLAAAIAAAQAAAQANPQANPQQNQSNAANFNPFLQLFKKQ